MKKSKKIYYYKSYESDVVQSHNQEYKIKDDYEWIHTNRVYNFLSNIGYAIAKFIGIIYCKLILKVKIENAEILKPYKSQGYFIYGNHTQEIGDVFIPAIVCKRKRIYTIASPANLGVKFIGPLLPSLGILPIAETVSGTKKLYKAVKQRLEEKHPIIIYPEAHVWPYYTKIRPFQSTSFKFPVDLEAVAFSMTTTYYKRKNRGKPGIKVYIDGPFKQNSNFTKKQNQERMSNEIYQKMQERTKNNNYEYVKYKKVEE